MQLDEVVAKADGELVADERLLATLRKIRGNKKKVVKVFLNLVSTIRAS